MEHAAGLLEEACSILRLGAFLLATFEPALQLVALRVEQLPCGVQLLRVTQAGAQRALEAVGDGVQLAPPRAPHLESRFALVQDLLRSTAFLSFRLVLAFLVLERTRLQLCLTKRLTHILPGREPFPEPRERFRCG
jgi:hypothetical protein